MVVLSFCTRACRAFWQPHITGTRPLRVSWGFDNIWVAAICDPVLRIALLHMIFYLYGAHRVTKREASIRPDRINAV